MYGTKGLRKMLVIYLTVPAAVSAGESQQPGLKKKLQEGHPF